MKVTVFEGTPEEIKKVLQAIASSEEQPKDFFTFPEKGTITLTDNRIVCKEWDDEDGEHRTSTDITRMQS